MTKLDPLNLFRGYRDKLKEYPEFNNFKSKKIEKLIQSAKGNLNNYEIENNLENVNKYFYNKVNLIINFESENNDNNFIIEINKNIFSEKSVLKEMSNKNKDNFNSNSNDNLNLENKEENEKLNSINIENIMNVDNIDNVKNNNLSENLNLLIHNNSLISNPSTIRHSDLKIINKQYEEEIEKLYENKIIKTEDITNIDILKYKVECNYYTNLNQFLNDLFSMFKNISKNLQNLISNEILNNSEQFINISTIFQEYIKSSFILAIQIIQIDKKNFKNLFEKDIKSIIDSNKLPKTNSMFKNIPIVKGYQTIEEYHHIFPEITKIKTKTNLTPNCNGSCCNNYEDLGPLNLEKMKWDSKCCDRENNLECQEDICGCTIENCKNMEISLKKVKNLDNKIDKMDVIEKYAWGIDLFTYRNLLEFLPLNFTDEFKANYFIEQVLIKSLSDLDVEGYSIEKALFKIVNKYNFNSTDNNFDNNFKEVILFFAEHLLNVYKNSKFAKLQTQIAFSKGTGIFCQKKEGIKENELISVYLGEIYPPWYWYEKQDLIKKNKLDKELPDFYNIMLERLKRDQRGFDLVMVDPNSKGNFASRMSHSCIPNCTTVLMCSNGEYKIGMYATKNIKMGDELTFDYNSVTEKEKEFQDAICLCSSFNCRGHYLIYSNSVLFTEILSKFHNFLHRNAILLKACDVNFEMNKEKELLMIDLDLFNKYSIGCSILEEAPFWLKKWAALILRYVDLEAKLLGNIKNLESEGNEINSNSGNKSKNLFVDLVLNFNNSNNVNFNNINQIKNASNFNTNNANKNNNNNIKNESNSVIINKKSKNKNSNNINSTKLSYSTKSNSSNVKNKPINNYDKNSYVYYGLKQYKSSTRGNKIIISKEEIKDAHIKLVEEEFNKIFNDNLNENCNISRIVEGDVEMKNETENNIKENSFDFKIEILPDEQNIIIKEETEANRDEIITTSGNNNNNLFNNEEIKIKQDFIENILNNNEEEKYKNDLNNSTNNNQHTLNGITENRIQNLAITIDKVIHVLKLMKTDTPPLVILTEEEINEFYWGKEDSIRSNLEENLKKIINNVEFNLLSDKVREIISKVYNIVTYFNNKNIKNNEEIRIIFKQISNFFKECSLIDKTRKLIFYDGLADILFLYGSTNCYFKSNNKYTSAESNMIQIRQRDINTSNGDLDSIVCQGQKSYDKLYIWGQLVDKPNASLSAERRGSLAYPEVDSFFINGTENNKKSKSTNSGIFQYPGGPRENFYSRLIENPSMMWPVGNEWSFKNKNKIYGTVQFDSIFSVNENATTNSVGIESINYFINQLRAMENNINFNISNSNHNLDSSKNDLIKKDDKNFYSQMLNINN